MSGGGKGMRLFGALALAAMLAASAQAQPTTSFIAPGAFGDRHWCAPVASVLFLPPSGNSPGDTRRVIDTWKIYYWDGAAWQLDASAQGPPGPAGPTGPSGAPGAAATVAAGTTTTGAPGSSAAVANSGTSNAAVFDFTIPRGAAGASGPQGAPGLDGRTVLSGSGAPSSGTGADGDFYLDTAATSIYGPKTSGAWGAGTSLIGATGATGATGSSGATGATGAQGPAGADGANGSTWLSGSAAPSSGAGVNGDYYFRTATGDVYGKAAGAWSIIANLTGPAGATGAAGAAGPAGTDGIPRTIQDEGVDLAQRLKVNFTGAGVACADNPGQSRTDCTIGSSGSGDVTGPSSSVDNSVARMSGLTGKIIKGGPIQIADDGAMTSNALISDFGTPIIWIDAEGLTNGSSVSSLHNQGSAGDFSETTASMRPTVVTNVINGYPVLRFDGGDCLTNPSVSISTFTFLIVFRSISPQGSGVLYEHSPNVNSNDGSYLNTGSNNAANVKRGGVSSQRDFGYTESGTTHRFDWGNDDAWHIVLHSFKGTHQTHRIVPDGSYWSPQVPITSNLASAATVTAEFNIGCRDESSFFFTGDIALMVGFSPALTTAQARSLLLVLQTKYNR